MEQLFELLQTYWVETLSAVTVAILGIFRKWVGKKVIDFFGWAKSICPGRSVVKRLEEIQAELKPNHGSSIKDAINRIEYKITGINTKMNIVMTGLDIVSDTLNICRWAADRNGLINFVNNPLRELIGSTDDMAWSIGDAWTNTVFKDDRDAAIEEWSRCVKSKIEYHDSYRIVHAITGKVIKITSHAKVIRGMDGTVEGWVGVVIPHNTEK